MSRLWARLKPPQKGWSCGNSSAEASIASATIASTQAGHLELPAPARLGVVAGERRDQRRHRLAIAAQQPEDARCPAALEGERRASRPRSSRGGRARSARPARGRPPRRSCVRSSHSATRLARLRQAASAFSAPIRAASASRPRRSRVAPIAAAAACSRAAVSAGVARLGVDPVDLVQPVAGGHLERLGRPRGLDGGAEAALRRVLRRRGSRAGPLPTPR